MKAKNGVDDKHHIMDRNAIRRPRETGSESESELILFYPSSDGRYKQQSIANCTVMNMIMVWENMEIIYCTT